MPTTATTKTPYPESAVSALAGAITATKNQDPEALAAELLEHLSVNYDIRRKTGQVTTPAPEPAIGQVWRNKKSDRLVQITATTGMGDMQWTALTGRGPSTGTGWRGYWRDRFDYVEG